MFVLFILSGPLLAGLKQEFNCPLSNHIIFVLSILPEPLLAGLPQEFIVSLSSGSKRFDDSHTLQVLTTEGLDVTGDNMSNGLKTLPAVEPYKTLDIVLTLTADLDPEPTDQIFHQITVVCDWLTGNVTYPMTFKHPLNITHKLHTAGKRWGLRWCV